MYGADMLHQVHEGVTFDIELAAGPVFEKFGECRNVIVSDMSLVRTRMDCQTEASANKVFPVPAFPLIATNCMLGFNKASTAKACSAFLG